MERYLGMARIPFVLLMVAHITAKGNHIPEDESPGSLVLKPSSLNVLDYLSFSRGKVVLAVSTLLVLAVLLGTPKKKQRLVPGIPVVGGDDRASILMNRKRFIHDGKNMLLDGYQKAMNPLPDSCLILLNDPSSIAEMLSISLVV